MPRNFNINYHLNLVVKEHSFCAFVKFYIKILSLQILSATNSQNFEMFCHVCVFNIIWNLQISIGRLFKMCAGQQKTNLENAYFLLKLKLNIGYCQGNCTCLSLLMRESVKLFLASCVVLQLVLIAFYCFQNLRFLQA